MRDVMSTDQGKRVVWEIMELCGVASKNMHLDAILMARQEGKRSAGLDVQSWATMSAPEHMMRMIIDNGEKIGLLSEDQEHEEEDS